MYRGSGHRLAQWEGVYSWSAIHHRLSNAISDCEVPRSPRRPRDDTVLSAKQIPLHRSATMSIDPAFASWSARKPCSRAQSAARSQLHPILPLLLRRIPAIDRQWPSKSYPG